MVFLYLLVLLYIFIYPRVSRSQPVVVMHPEGAVPEPALNSPKEVRSISRATAKW